MLKIHIASAANYLNNIGWKKNSPCFYKVSLKKDVPNKYLNVSAKKLIIKKNLNFLKNISTIFQILIAYYELKSCFNYP
jgi:membrane-bound lytic murein transglycosylase B